MWNAAFAVGGPACTIHQFEQTTGIRLDNYVVVDFTSFKGMVDAVGGVEVCVPEDIDDNEHGITVPAGTRTLDGNEALDYVRVRHGVGDGSDIGRIRRQQAFIGAHGEQGRLRRHPDPPRPGGEVPQRRHQVARPPTSRASRTWPRSALQFKNIGLKRIRFITVPFDYCTGRSRGRVFWTADGQTSSGTKITKDKPLGKLRDGSIGANQVPSGAAPGRASPRTERPAATRARRAPRRRAARPASRRRHRGAERRLRATASTPAGRPGASPGSAA